MVSGRIPRGGYDLGEAVIQPSPLSPDLGLAHSGMTARPTRLRRPPNGYLRMDNKPSTPYQHLRIPPLTR